MINSKLLLKFDIKSYLSKEFTVKTDDFYTDTDEIDKQIEKPGDNVTYDFDGERELGQDFCQITSLSAECDQNDHQVDKEDEEDPFQQETLSNESSDMVPMIDEPQSN